MSIVQLHVCKECLSPESVMADCICLNQDSYPTLLLQFEKCDKTGKISDKPINNNFNQIQIINGMV